MELEQFAQSKLIQYYVLTNDKNKCILSKQQQLKQETFTSFLSLDLYCFQTKFLLRFRFWSAKDLHKTNHHHFSISPINIIYKKIIHFRLSINMLKHSPGTLQFLHSNLFSFLKVQIYFNMIVFLLFIGLRFLITNPIFPSWVQSWLPQPFEIRSNLLNMNIQRLSFITRITAIVFAIISAGADGCPRARVCAQQYC